MENKTLDHLETEFDDAFMQAEENMLGAEINPIVAENVYAALEEDVISTLENELTRAATDAAQQVEQEDNVEPDVFEAVEPTDEQPIASEASEESPEQKVKPEDLREIVKQVRELVLSSKTREFVQQQVADITREAKQLRMAGINITQEEIEAVVQEAFQKGVEPATYFKLYAHDRLKNHVLYGKSQPSPAGFGTSRAATPGTQPQEGYQPPAFARYFGFVTPEQREQRTDTLPEFEDYLMREMEAEAFGLRE